MTIKEIIQKLYTAITDACLQESHFESWLILNEVIIDAIDALKALDKREPVAWMNDMGTHIDLNVSGRGIPLYTTPPQRKPLTVGEVWRNDQFMSLNTELGCGMDLLMEVVKAIEAAHNIKE